MFNPLRHNSFISGRAKACILFGGAAPLVAVLVMSLAFAQEDAEKEQGPVGLTGILPVEPPEALGFEAFSILDGNWTPWSEATAEQVGEFYMAENPSLEEQRAAIAGLRKRLKTMSKSLADRRFRSLWNPLTTMQGQLVRRVDLAEAILNTLELTPEKVRLTRLQGAAAAVSQSRRALERRLQSISGGSAWLPVVKSSEIVKLMQEPTNSDAALPTFKTIHAKLTDTDSLGTSQRQFLSRPEFTALATAIGNYIKAAEEEQPPLDEAKLREQLAQLVANIEEYEESGTLANVKAIQTALAEIGKISPDRGNRIRAVIDTYYRSYNFHIVASEEFLSRYMRETRNSSEPIGEYIGGSYVSGSQTTTASTAIDLKSSDRGALFDVTLRGVVRSSTIARASRANARIWSSGNHTFNARRNVRFNGDKFTLGARGAISVNANITTTGASTSYDGGIFARSARRRAYSAANARRGQSEATAANKIRNRVLPEFERETTREFQKLNKDIQEQWNKKLEEAKLEPAGRKVFSTDKHMTWSSRIATPAEFSGGATTKPPAPTKGLALQAHESLLNAMFDRMEIAGKTMTNAQFRKVVDDYLAILFGKDETKAPADNKPDDPDLYVFAATDPVRFQIENGVVNLIIRTGIRQEGKDEIPTQKITVPLTFRLEKESIVIERGSVQVKPIEKPKSVPEQFARAKVMGAKIEKDLGNRTRPRKVNLSRGEGKTDLVLNVSKVTALNGWLTITAQ